MGVGQNSKMVETKGAIPTGGETLEICIISRTAVFLKTTCLGRLGVGKALNSGLIIG